MRGLTQHLMKNGGKYFKNQKMNNKYVKSKSYFYFSTLNNTNAENT